MTVSSHAYELPKVNSQPVMSWDMMAAAGTNDVARYATTAASGLPAPIQAALQVWGECGESVGRVHHEMLGG